MRQPTEIPPRFIAHRREADGAIQSLEHHLHAVGKMSARNASKLKLHMDAGIRPARLEAAGEVLGLLHDLGKYSKAFQDYLGSAVGLIDQDADDYVNAAQLRGRVDHSTAGAQFIWLQLSKVGRGLKPDVGRRIGPRRMGIARRMCRAWIETTEDSSTFNHRVRCLRDDNVSDIQHHG